MHSVHWVNTACVHVISLWPVPVTGACPPVNGERKTPAMQQVPHSLPALRSFLTEERVSVCSALQAGQNSDREGSAPGEGLIEKPGFVFFWCRQKGGSNCGESDTPRFLKPTRRSVNELVKTCSTSRRGLGVSVSLTTSPKFDVISLSVTTSGFFFFFRSERNVRGHRNAQAYRLRGDSSLGTYLDSYAFIWINSHTSPRIGVTTASGSTRPTPGCPLGFGLLKDRAR